MLIIVICLFIIRYKNGKARKKKKRKELEIYEANKKIKDAEIQTRLAPLILKKKEEDKRLSKEKKIKCDDGVTRIYNGFMWGLIREIDKEKTINTSSIISHDESDNISLTSFRSAFRLEIPNEKWFSIKGKSLNSHEILNYLPSNKIHYESEFKDILPTVKYNPTYSKKIISINGYLFHDTIFGHSEPNKLFSGTIDKKEYFNGIPLEESVLHTKKFNSESLKHAVIEWLDNKELAEARYGHISKWNTSEVTDMNRLFRNANTFNESIETWDVSNVTDMTALFYKAYCFNQPIGNWDVSNVMDMSGIFCNAKSFNQPLDKWDISNVTSIKRMFDGAESFNQPLDNWDVSNVTDMDNMFRKGHDEMIKKYGENGGNLISNIEEESYENIESDFKNKSNDNETMSMSVTFSNTIFSEHPNTSLLIEKCDNSSSDFVNMSNNCIEGEFEIPAELRNYIEVLKYDIDTSEAFSNSNNYLTMDIDCTVTISIKTTKDEAIDAIEKYQEDNNDLRWSLSIKWIDADKKEQYSFDSWDVDMLEEIIEDEPCWYVED